MEGGGDLIPQCTLCHRRKKNNVDKYNLKDLMMDFRQFKIGYGEKFMKLRKTMMRLLAY